MDKKSTKSHTDDHNQLPSDEVTRNKIDKHLSDIDDTISEEDIRNINTVTGTENKVPESAEMVRSGKKNNHSGENEEPEEEAPTPWEILGE